MIYPLRTLPYFVLAFIVAGSLFYFFVYHNPFEASTMDEPEATVVEELKQPAENEEKIPFTIPEVDIEWHHHAYDSTIRAVLQEKNKLTSKYYNADSPFRKAEILAEAGQYLRKSLSETVFPAWYGTIWDFNGYTDKPREGLIACGYFVSTPLKHTGFKLNRYKLAQQAASDIITSLCPSGDVKVFSNNDFSGLLSYVDSKPDNMYVVGLDNHVGFIEKTDHKTYFIHSSYDTGVCGCVLREEAYYSSVLPYSNIYVLGNISDNPELIRKWLLTEQVTIVKG